MLLIILVLMGGHMVGGSLLSLLVCYTTYQFTKKDILSLLLAIGLYYVLCLIFWIIGDILFGPITFFTQMPQY